MNALLSVSDKTGLADLAAGLESLGVTIYATGGTERALREADETRARLRTRLRPGWEPAGEVDGRGG